jgi:myotubularin-related protein 9
VDTGKRGFVIDTRTAAAAQSERAKGGGYEIEQHYPKWKRITKCIDRYHFLLDSYSKLMEVQYVCGLTWPHVWRFRS